MHRDAILSAVFSVLVCISRCLLSIMTPLYLDSLNPLNSDALNISESSGINGSCHVDPVPVSPIGTPVWQRIDPFFGIWLSMGFDCVVSGLVVLFLFTFVPGTITERETSYSKPILLSSGCAQAVSALMYQFSTSGTRTAPYIQGALGYFYIPMAFTLRYFILHKRPTLRKFICAVIVIMGEFVCLIPTMFPHLESESDRRENGGASGAAGILWPLLFVLSDVPHALWNILLEKDTKNVHPGPDSVDAGRLHIAYVMFWNFLGTFLTALLLFWIDLIPGFGMMPNVKFFFPQFWFNIKCIFGAVDVCGFHQVFTAWGRMVAKTITFVICGLLVRYGEGANIYALMMAIVTPLVFLVFTLMDEQTARWQPHATLSTWLSLGALAVMIPTVIMYNLGDKEITVTSSETHGTPSESEIDEDAPLMNGTSTYGSINTDGLA